MKVYYKQVQLNPTTTTDYTDLLDKPQINSVELVGDLSTEQIKITWFGTQDEFDALGTYDPHTFYIIDDGSPETINKDYLDLANKPAINGQVLTGNKTASDLNMYTAEEIDTMLAALRSIEVVSALPSTPKANTMYYVGPDADDNYSVYLFDSLTNEIDLGLSVQKLYTAGEATKIVDMPGNTSRLSAMIDHKTIGVDSNNKLEAIKKGILDMLYPVGSIFLTVAYSTPAQVAAAMGGTWVAWGAGRTIVAGDTAESTGGNKSVTATSSAATGNTGSTALTKSQVPNHAHSIMIWNNANQNYNAAVANGTGGSSTATQGLLTGGGRWINGNFKTANSWNNIGDRGGNTDVSGSGNGHTHTLNDHTHTATVSSLQPYITCYMYKRTA